MLARLQRYLITGALTAVPLWITFLVCRFVLELMAGISMPAVRRAFPAFEKYLPGAGAALAEPWFQWSAAFLITIFLIMLLGAIATNVVGRRVMLAIDRLMARIPIVQQVYGATRKLVDALQSKPEGAKRVVLIEFPGPGMHTVGLVTKTMTDSGTGEALAAVYVPTTPNPTSGYLEIVPVANLIETNWNLDEAMTFVMSGGVVAPENVEIRRSPPKADTGNTP